MDNPSFGWEEWDKSSRSVESVIAFVNDILEREIKYRYKYFAIVPSKELVVIVFIDEEEEKQK